MPSISSCPECHRDLTLPDLEGELTLRCPLCGAQFPAERILADSIDFPPAAIVVSRGNAPPPVADRPAESEPSPAATSRDTGVAENVSRTSKYEPDSHESDVDESDLDESDVEEVDDDSSSRDSEIVDSEASPDYASFGQQAAGMRTARRTKQEATPLGFFGQLVGMALGGVVGLAIGYWVLLWIGGPQVDFLHLRGKVPRWLVPGRRHNDAGKGPPVASRRSLGDVLRDPPNQGTHDAPTPAEVPSRVAEPLTQDTAPIADEPSALTDGRRGSVPPLERPPLGTGAFPDGYLGPRAFKSRTVSELTTVLERADRALRCPHCQAPSAVKLAAFTAPARQTAAEDLSTPRRCEYCRGKPLTNLTAAAFDRLCDLAETVTFVQFDEGDADRDECRRAAEAIAMAIGGQRERMEIAGRLAGQRLDESQRQSNGILLAGIVQRVEREGELFAIHVMLAGCGKPVTVISREPPEPPVERRDRLVVLGSIVDSPRDNLAGYAGNLSQVVWGGLPLKLASPAR